MSTLNLTTLAKQDGSSSVPVDTVINGSAKAWVNFNGTGTVAITSSFNVTSITDNGTGDYTANFTSAMSDTGYAFSLSVGTLGTYGSALSCGPHRGNIAQWSIKTTTAIRVATGYLTETAGAVEDREAVSVVIFR